MPEHCAAYCCANRRTIANRGRGITFHKFPKDKDMRKKWEVALSRERFTASESSLQLPGSPPKNLQIDFKAKQGHEYSKDHREFALTLHLHGPKAYKYHRETTNLPLPHPHTLQRWLCSVDGKPGLNKMMLERRCHEDQAKYGCVALMLDAMAIRKHVQYNPHNQSMSGFVDMGDGNNETDVATEALVFMVVGLQGHWKAPIAYYLTKSLSPETQRVLLSHALEELDARGIRVVSVTMDGHASNVTMCNQLGCELKGNPQEPLQTSFPHPSTGDKVFVMMDACHMLKLARNMLQTSRICSYEYLGIM
ncbi:hypothetical protein JOQ06_021427 [Pogonophryne albipinna]|uniref:THAP-type domain-containing protein n=1 Tax=Pogonophryne albipinna TaxID=1090488 RepID=A0AAD6F7J6_9TELE|nr:hypothetical protein JOQ06_021427 [Pogonophryne albipinna]